MKTSTRQTAFTLFIVFLIFVFPARAWTSDAGASRVEARVTVALVLLERQSGLQTTTDLSSLGTFVRTPSQLIPGTSVFLEIWCKTPPPNGVFTAAVDVEYEATFFDTSVGQVSLAPQWPTMPFTVSVDDAGGLVDDLGGTVDYSSGLPGIGIAPDWARLGTIEFDVTSTPLNPVLFCTRWAGVFKSFAIWAEGNVDPSDVEYGCFLVGCSVVADCDDSIECTTDTCDPDTGCVNTPVDAACDDGNECTGDRCDPAASGHAGGCVNAFEPVDTPCGDPTDTVCDNPDACDGNGSCLDNYEPTGTLCVDELFCNGEEACDGAGRCLPGTDPCTDPWRPECDDADNMCVECLMLGDTNEDRRINLQDFASFPGCNTGPVGPAAPPAYPAACRCLDSDGDGDVDVADFAEFQRNFSG